MGKKKRGKASKLVRKAQRAHEEEEFKNAPHSFVFHRGKVGRCIHKLIHDIKEVMQPFTASSLKVKKTNSLQDFVNISGPLGVTHFLVVTKSPITNYLKIVRMPRGPTLTFRFKYTLSKDVRATSKKPNILRKIFFNHPLVVLNNFSGEEVHLKLMATMFQNMFQSISINKLQLKAVRRLVLLNYDHSTHEVLFRHYSIRVAPVGLTRPVQKLLKNKVPNLGRFEDISQFVEAGGNLSESEAEFDGPHNKVTLPQALEGRGNRKSQQSAIRLKEIGPRLTLELIKIEDGVNGGKVLFHRYIQKTPEELKKLEANRAKKRKLKATRKKIQEENVRRKTQVRALHKEKSLQGIRKQQEDDVNTAEEENGEEDDEEYYRQEVGAEPEPEFFPRQRTKRKRPQTQQQQRPTKRPKVSNMRKATRMSHMAGKNKKNK